MSLGASHQTTNFIVEAPTVMIARQVGAVAEASREELAVLWFGHKLPRWSTACQVTVVVGARLGAGGSTRFRFDNGHVFGWQMRVQGSLERILDSVIPHEVNHTILACYFRRPVPRWADEGAASLMEHTSEQQHQIDLVDRLMRQGRRIPLRMLLNIAEYPRDMEQVMALYAEGYSLARYLIQLGGRQKFLRFLDDAHHRSWDQAIQSFYQKKSIEKLETDWSGWVLAGRPSPEEPAPVLLAAGQVRAASGRVKEASGRVKEVVRSQNPHRGQATDQQPVFAPRPVRQSRTPGLARIFRSELGAAAGQATTRAEFSVRTQPDSPAGRQALVPLRLEPLSAPEQPPVKLRMTSTEQLPVPTVSEEAAFGRGLKETHIRIRDLPLPVPVRARVWTRFPQSVVQAPE